MRRRVSDGTFLHGQMSSGIASVVPWILEYDHIDLVACNAFVSGHLPSREEEI